MVKYIDDKTTFEEFDLKYQTKDSMLFPLWKNREVHPILQNPIGCFVFIGEECWVIMETHNDCLSIPLSILNKGNQTRWIFDSKWGLHYFGFQTKSIDGALWLDRYETISYDDLYAKLSIGGKRNVDASVYPITKLTELVAEIVFATKGKITNLPFGFENFNDLVLPTFRDIERNGIPTIEGIEYSLYNNFTTTGRPTNVFGGINYSAMNRNDGSRDRILSKEGNFYQFDYDGYHIRLIAKLIGEKIDHQSAHEWLGSQYFGKDELTDEEYQQSKAITFRQLYGGIDSEILDIPFFSKTQNYIQQLYNNFVVNGYLQTRMGKRIPFSKISDPTPQKVFNYFLQSLETETNVYILKALNELLKGKMTKLVMYTYDSFLFDCHIDEEYLHHQIEEILHQIAPTELKVGKRFSDL